LPGKTGGKAIIYDVKGEFVGKFYDPRRDLIFNPLDIRGIRWNVFNEVRTRTDIEALAGSLIPEAKGTNEEWWNEAARDVLIGLLHYTWQNPETRNMTALWKNITASGPEKAQMLGSIPEGARGLSYVAEGNNNQAKGVFGKLMQYAKSFEYLQGDVGSDFSISRWLTQPEGRFIFLSNYSDLQDTLRPVLSLFIDFMGKRILAMPDDRNRRLYFFVDEVATLNRLPSLVNLLTLSRSKGGSIWISTQDVGRLDQVYNQNIRQSIINSTGNKLFFAAGDNVTAEHLSRITGNHIVSKPSQSAMISVSNERDSQSFQRREENEDLVMISEYLYMKTLECVIILVDQNPARMEMQYVAHPVRNSEIKLRSDLDLEKIRKEQDEREPTFLTSS
jgi:type IV secretory pathway TraG/TraD family ATPase VirD4